jgi:ABC-type transporter Mla subunit MlaD
MNLFQAVAPVISHWATIAVVVSFLTAWAVVSAYFLLRATRKLKSALNKATRAISEAATPVDFRERYEDIRARLLAILVLRSRWRDFADSLVVPRDRGRPLQSTARPDRWFNLGLLGSREIGLNMRYHAALPNLLVGAGLLFTFFGLAVALSSASGIVDGDAGARNNALRQLLDTASFKFITSLAGLFLSIVYTVIYKSQLRSVERSMEHFVDSVEERVPPITAVSLQQESNALLERQLTFAESLANDLSLAMQQAFDQAFDQRLGEHIKPLREAMETLAGRISGSNEDAIKTMLDSFVSRLQGGAGDRMQDVASTLADLGQSLESLQTGLGEAAARMAESADTMARRMGEGAEAALTRITDQMGGVAETLRAVAEQTRGAGAEAGRELAQQLGAAASGFEAASREIAAGFERAAEGLEAKMGEQAQASAERLNRQFEAMVAELQRLASASRATGTEALGALSDKVATSADAFEAMAGRISALLDDAAARTGGAFGKSAEEAVQRIASATEGMRAELAALIADLRSSAAAAGETIRNGGVEGADIIKATLGDAGSTIGASLAQAAGALASAGERAGASLQHGGEKAATRLTEASGAFGGRAENLGAQVDALTRTTEGVVHRLGEFNTAARDAAGPLASISNDLRTASNALRDTVKPLATSAESVGRAIEQLSGSMQRLETTQTKAGHLADGVRGAAERFSGVDRELANVLSELQKGLQGFAQEVSRCVKETDGQLARAVSQLQGLLSDLQSTIEDMGPLKPQPTSLRR